MILNKPISNRSREWLREISNMEHEDEFVAPPAIDLQPPPVRPPPSYGEDGPQEITALESYSFSTSGCVSRCDEDTFLRVAQAGG